MVPGRSARLRSGRRRLADVFLNIPYDEKFQNLYLAYIAGISAYGSVPRTTLEIPGGERRLDRIFSLIRACQYSVHDLSRVELDRRPPRTPRFNMPFELGLAVAWARTNLRKHVWFVCEAMERRIEKSLSDLKGTDVHIHNGNVRGVFRELGDAFVRSERQPAVPQMWRVFRDVKRSLPNILRSAGTGSVYRARVFRDLCVVASASADRNVL